MCLATKHDVDMVLLAGDLFHENKPSRKSMYQVMRSLRMNCYGDRPCELEMLSDASENFQGAFNHVNYEDLDINVALPVFSIHGNHDDPSGEGHLAALDLLQVSGLINYYGRTPEADNILIKPVLLQKGRTKLALYGMSNVRDERLFRTFRDGKVKFFQPSTQKSDWFNLMSVHQNHHAHTETGYLPENFLPDFLDLVVWGHEHECLIDPRLNPETGFHVMQPGSSVATSLVPGEAVPKHVSILSITGREFKTENIRLKSVRPFVMREISLQEEKSVQKLARKENNRTEITRFLMGIVDELIEEAKAEWLETQEDEEDEEIEVPLPLVRLRVETSTPDGSFDTENPQRFSNRFVGKVANVNDVVQFHRKKKAGNALSKDNIDVPDESLSSGLASLDTVKVEKLVREFLTAQSLTILPQNSFGDAVSQFVDKDDKHAMEMFVNESLENQIKHLLALDRDPDNEMDYDDEEGQSSIQEAMDKYRTQLEEMFSKGAARKRGGKKRFKPRPDGWDSEFDGVWEDQPGALIHSDHEGGDQDEEEDGSRATTRARPTTTSTSTRGRRGGARAGRAASTAASTRGGRAAAASTRKAAAPTTTSRSRRQQQQQHIISDDDEDADEDIIMAHEVSEDDDEEVEVEASDDSDSLFVKQSAPKSKPKAAAPPPASTRSAPSRSTRNPAPPTSTSTSASQRTSRARPSPAPSSATLGASTASRKPPARGKKLTQSTLNMGGGASQDQSQSQARSSRSGVVGGTGTGTGTRARTTRSMSVVSDGIEDDDDEDAFEPAPTSMGSKRRR